MDPSTTTNIFKIDAGIKDAWTPLQGQKPQGKSITELQALSEQYQALIKLQQSNIDRAEQATEASNRDTVLTALNRLQDKAQKGFLQVEQQLQKVQQQSLPDAHQPTIQQVWPTTLSHVSSDPDTSMASDRLQLTTISSPANAVQANMSPVLPAVQVMQPTALQPIITNHSNDAASSFSNNPRHSPTSGTADEPIDIDAIASQDTEDGQYVQPSRETMVTTPTGRTYTKQVVAVDRSNATANVPQHMQPHAQPPSIANSTITTSLAPVFDRNTFNRKRTKHDSPPSSDEKPIARLARPEPSIDVVPVITSPPAPAANAFISGRDKFIADEAKKNPAAARRMHINRQLEDEARGTRKPGKFIPPYKSRQTTDDDIIDQTNAPSFVKTALKGKKDDAELPERLKGCEPKLVEMIENEMMEAGESISWEDIAGLQFAKRSVQEIVVWPMLRPELFKGLRGPPKGILLFGPPGTGKTLIGKAIACQAGAKFFNISASSLTSKWHGEGEKLMRTLFAVAGYYQPSIIFIDEIDSLLTQRTESEFEASRRIKTEFLVQFDGVGTSTNERVLVVGATNRPQELDEAARRRLVKRLYIPLPDFAARKQLLKLLLKDETIAMPDEVFDSIAQKTEGYSGADIRALSTEAAYGPLRESLANSSDIKGLSAADVRPINESDFLAAMRQVRASVSRTQLSGFIDWNDQYGSFAHDEGIAQDRALARRLSTTRSPSPTVLNVHDA